MKQDYTILKSAAARLLLAHGIAPTQDAFWQFMTGIDILSASPSMLTNTQKLLYPAIADQCGCSYYSVDNSLRRAIKKAWESGNIPTVKRPTAAEFFTMLMLELAEENLTSTC